MKLLLFIICVFSSCVLDAQKGLSVYYDTSDFSFHREIYFPNSQTQFKDYGEMWFSTTTDLVNIGEIPPLSIDPWGQKALLVNVFPDSTIVLGIDPSTNSSYRFSLYDAYDGYDLPESADIHDVCKEAASADDAIQVALKVYKSCSHTPTKTSGRYRINPSGAEDGAFYEVICDYPKPKHHLLYIYACK